MLVYFIAELLSVAACKINMIVKGNVRVLVARGRTISAMPLQIHPGRKRAFGAYSALHLQLVFWRSVLHDVGLEDETGMPSLGGRRESRCNFALGTEKLSYGSARDQPYLEKVTDMDVTCWHFGEAVQATGDTK